MGTITIVAVAVAIISAVRSTWSPCGLSMLSTITPISERGRGYRFATTAAWFILGAAAGGVTLGLGAALLAGGSSALHLSTSAALALASGAALVAAAADAGLMGVRFPIFRRQVNEQWLDRYRAWLYGGGFGWQIGIGVATYIMTAGVFLTVVLAVLTGAPVTALLVCTAFGVSRGLTVLLTRRLVTPDALRTFHRRFDRLAEPVRVATIVVEALGAVVLAAMLWVPAAVGLGVAMAAVVVVRHGSRLQGRRLHPRGVVPTGQQYGPGSP